MRTRTLIAARNKLGILFRAGRGRNIRTRKRLVSRKVSVGERFEKSLTGLVHRVFELTDSPYLAANFSSSNTTPSCSSAYTAISNLRASATRATCLCFLRSSRS